MSIAMELSKKILNIVEKSPVCQSDLVYTLNVRDQRIAEAVKILIGEHKISRIKVGHTYLINLNGSHNRPQLQSADFNILLHGGVFSPCCGCRLECVPSTCDKITEWIK